MFNWNGAIEVNGERVNEIDFSKYSGPIRISLKPSKVEKSPIERTTSVTPVVDKEEYSITVKGYMTKKSTSDFNFMEKWNNNVPMPLKTMVGSIVKETKGMVYMKLRGDLVSTLTPCCLKCGRPITNPVSQYFGMGPECGNHRYTNPFDSEEELRANVEKYRVEVLNKLTWEGWIIKSAIEEKTAI